MNSRDAANLKEAKGWVGTRFESGGESIEVRDAYWTELGGVTVEVYRRGLELLGYSEAWGLWNGRTV